MGCCGVIYGGRYVWWITVRSLVLLMIILAGAMPGWSYESITGTRIGIYHSCMRALCDQTWMTAEALSVPDGLVIASGVLSVLGPVLVALNIMLMTLDVGAKGRINGRKYRTFVVLRNRMNARATYFNFFFDLFTFSEIPAVLANIVVYIITHVLYYKDFTFFVCFFVYIGALVLLFVVDIHILVIKLMHRRRVTPPENIWNPGLLENPALYDKGGWDLVISNDI